MASELLPIKVVSPSPIDARKPENTGRDFDPVRPVTPEFRRQLKAGVAQTKQHLSHTFERWKDLPAIATVTLHEDARAKSRRPSDVFNADTCPIIGTGKPGQLIISVTERALDRVQQRIDNDTKRGTAHVSTIASIQAYEPEVDVPMEPMPLRVRLARHRDPSVNKAINIAFENLVTSGGSRANAKALNYAPSLSIYRVDGLSREAVAPLREFCNIQSITPFPQYSVVRSAAHVLRPMTDDALPAPSSGTEYAVVGVIDSGTDPANTRLQAWVKTRDEMWVPSDRQNNDHGSFVAGLIANARGLNHGDARFPASRSKIVDVVAFDKDGRVFEDELLAILDKSLIAYPGVRVWNLSIGLTGPCCSDDEISELAAALDDRSRAFNVLFVIAAGNLHSLPFRHWPLNGQVVDDRIRPPADALRALTVGGLAHTITASTIAEREGPSPFSRRGPAAGGLIKPDLSHYAGNVDGNGRYVQTGIISMDGSGNVAENVGTSFACPLVSTIAAATFHELDTSPTESASLLQLKAMLIHSAFVKSSPLDSRVVNYRGLGTPGDTNELLSCRQSSATIIMNVKVSPSTMFEKDPFPMPNCLVKNGVLRGSVFMTVLADCPVDRGFGLEYCRTNVTASLATQHASKRDKKGRLAYNRQIGPALGPDGSDLDDDQVDQGFRWSPLKLYYRRFKRGPVRPWRLRVKAMNRAEHTDLSEQEVAIIITITSVVDNDPVYDQLVRQMEELAWVVKDLPVRSRIRGRSR